MATLGRELIGFVFRSRITMPCKNIWNGSLILDCSQTVKLLLTALALLSPPPLTV